MSQYQNHRIGLPFVHLSGLTICEKGPFPKIGSPSSACALSVHQGRLIGDISARSKLPKVASFLALTRQPVPQSGEVAIPRVARYFLTMLTSLVALSLMLAPSASELPTVAQDSLRQQAWAELGEVDIARERADTVVIALIHHVAQPRASEGNCRAYGQVVNVERGTSFAFGNIIAANVPCSSMPGAASTAHVVPRSMMADHSWVRMYYSSHKIVDFQPLELRPSIDSHSNE